MGNIMNLMQIIGMARQNPQQAVMNILQQGFQNGSINKQQYDLLMNQLLIHGKHRIGSVEIHLLL